MVMPLTKKGEKIRAAMHEQYGAKKGESVFYASINAGKIKGAEKTGEAPNPSTDTPLNFSGHPKHSVKHHSSGRGLHSAPDPGGRKAPGFDRS
jgi:hypothetical protein